MPEPKKSPIPQYDEGWNAIGGVVTVIAPALKFFGSFFTDSNVYLVSVPEIIFKIGHLLKGQVKKRGLMGFIAIIRYH